MQVKSFYFCMRHFACLQEALILIFNILTCFACPQEALKLEEHIQCFTWQFNIGGAVGQATGTLAFTWLVLSVIIWIFVHLNHNTWYKESNCKRKFYFFLAAVIRITIIAFAVILMIITVIFTHKGWISFLSAIEIGTFCFLVVSFAVIPIVATKKNWRPRISKYRRWRREKYDDLLWCGTMRNACWIAETAET